MIYDLSNIISAILILIFVLHPIPQSDICSPGLIMSLLRTVTHGDISHLFFNLTSFHNISNILVYQNGRSGYAFILSAIWLLDIVSDWVLTNYGIKSCAIGFSGVVFGLLTYMFLQSGNELRNVALNLLLLLAPGFMSSHISNTGHMVGIINGAIVYFLMT